VTRIILRTKWSFGNFSASDDKGVAPTKSLGMYAYICFRDVKMNLVVFVLVFN
jgi:hypothetical protein